MIPLKFKFYSCRDYALATYSKEMKSWMFRKFPIYFKVQLLLISIQIGLVLLQFFFFHFLLPVCSGFQMFALLGALL
jgi:hypothetical protein